MAGPGAEDGEPEQANLTDEQTESFPVQKIPSGDELIPSGEMSPTEHQQALGTLLALLVAGSIGIVLVLVFVLAVKGKDPQYIADVVQTVSPFILPALGALVGYAFAERKQNGQG